MAKKKAAGAPLSMADRDGWIWHDGKLVPWREATTHVLTHSLHYGLAVFEGVRAYKTAIGTAIFRLKEHTDRLFSSAHIYMMKIPYTREKLMQAQLEVVKANGHEACYIRPIAFYGSEKMGVSPVGAKVHVAIAAWPWGAYLGPEALSKGIRVKTSSYARHHVNVTMARRTGCGGVSSVTTTPEIEPVPTVGRDSASRCSGACAAPAGTDQSAMTSAIRPWRRSKVGSEEGSGEAS